MPASTFLQPQISQPLGVQSNQAGQSATIEALQTVQVLAPAPGDSQRLPTVNNSRAVHSFTQPGLGVTFALPSLDTEGLELGDCAWHDKGQTWYRVENFNPVMLRRANLESSLAVFSGEEVPSGRLQFSPLGRLGIGQVLGSYPGIAHEGADFYDLFVEVPDARAQLDVAHIHQASASASLLSQAVRVGFDGIFPSFVPNAFSGIALANGACFRLSASELSQTRILANASSNADFNERAIVTIRAFSGAPNQYGLISSGSDSILDAASILTSG